ncbi:PHP-associated domain-containing protein [Chloroflexota bacterium]
MLKADFHIHTEYSMDCSSPLDKIIQRCEQLGINCIAIADHGTVEGALKMQKIAPFKVIVAEEILTPHGEIMGMFLKETIPSGLSVPETIRAIREQGGLINIPHPFDTVRPSALKRKIVEEIITEIDLIEVFNSRNILRRNAREALAFAEKHNIPKSAGSDAHSIPEIGNAYLEMPEFQGENDFLEALAQGKVSGRRTNPMIHFNSRWTKIKNSFKKG